MVVARSAVGIAKQSMRASQRITASGFLGPVYVVAAVAEQLRVWGMATRGGHGFRCGQPIMAGEAKGTLLTDRLVRHVKIRPNQARLVTVHTVIPRVLRKPKHAGFRIAMGTTDVVRYAVTIAAGFQNSTSRRRCRALLSSDTHPCSQEKQC